jgi:hypothetical protein
MRESADLASPGFQGSETSWAELTIYQHGSDPIVICSPSLPMDGRRSADKNPSLIACSTSKALGQASGSFSAQLKPGRAAEELLDKVMDDAWADVVFYRHSRPWHTMRGLLDELRRSDTVGGSGATTSRYTLTGRDFGKVWELTPVWFSPWANDLVTEAVCNRLWQGLPQVLGDPVAVAQAYLKGMLEEMGSSGPDWQPPTGMPGMQGGSSFLDNVTFAVKGYQNIPMRKAFNPNHLAPQGTLWTLAQSQADPAFVELYVDLLPDGDPLGGSLASGEAVPVGKAKMTVVVRDRPFPVTDANPAALPPLGYADAWGQLPVAVVPRQQLGMLDLGKSGIERFNAFFVASNLLQEDMGASALNVLAPLLDTQDVQRHGLRRFDVQIPTIPDPDPSNTVLDAGAQAEILRCIARDWYCLNPYMLSGSASLNVGRPDIHIGQRVRIPSLHPGQPDLNAYVEQVGHSWQFGSTIKTNLGLTRGWRGDDDSYRNALRKVAARYKVPRFVIDQAFNSALA